MTDRKRQIERLFKQHYRAMYRLASILLHDDEESTEEGIPVVPVWKWLMDV